MLLFFFLACGGSPPPEPAAAPIALAQPRAASPAPADVSAVAEPPTLLVLGNVAKPSVALHVVGAWTSLPMPAADEVSELITGAAVGRALDLEKPADVAIASDPRGKGVKPLIAVSVAVRSLEDATAALSETFKLVPGSGGIIKLEERKKAKSAPGSEDDEEGSERRCELSPAFGAATTRLVCAGSDGALLLLGPYLTRTATRAAYPTDVHVQVKLDPIKPMVAQGRAMLPMLVTSMLGSHGAGAGALAELTQAIVGDGVDLVLDLDTISFDVALGEPAATLTLTARFKDTSSFLARLATRHPERADALPPIFFHLPADADAAFFSYGVDAKEMEHPRDLVLEAIHRSLDRDAVPAADTGAVVNAVKDYMALFSSSGVYAKGVDWAASQKALAEAKNAPAATKSAAERAALQQLAGWSLIGTDEPFAKVGSLAKEWVAAWNRPGITKWLKDQAKDTAPTTLKIQPLSKGITLPKDTMHLELTVVHTVAQDPSEPPPVVKKGAPPAKPALAKPITLHIFVVPDAGRTWIAFGADEALAASRVRVALSTGTDGNTLAKREGLEELKNAKINSGGFFSVRSLVSGSSFGWILDRPSSTLKDPFRGLSATAQQGQTPVPFSRLAMPQSGGPREGVVFTAKLPRAAIQDIVAAAVAY